jgi:hypothetical protein
MWWWPLCGRTAGRAPLGCREDRSGVLAVIIFRQAH